MRQTKRRMELLSFYDHTGIERHLTRMARKGWKVEKINNYFWTYRRIEPQELQVAVTYFPKASDFDPFPSGEQQTLIDYCGETGWELACTWFQMQVFYSDRENPTPIHTEPELEVRIIHQACKANYLRVLWFLLVLGAIGSVLYASSMISDTLRMMASPGALLMGTCGLMLFLIAAVELVAYYTWRHRAKRAAQQGLFLDTPSTKKFQTVMMAVLLAALFWWGVNLALVGNPVMAWIVLVVAIGYGVLIALTLGVKRLLKEVGVSAGANRGLTLLACVVFAFVVMGGAVRFGIYLAAGSESPEDLSFYVETPLYMTDLVGEQEVFFSNATSSDQSLLLQRLKVEQLPWGREDETPQMTYERYTVSVPALYPFCVGQMKRQMLIKAYWDGEMVSVDATPWGAEEAYRLVAKDGTQRNAFLLCRGNILVSVDMSWEPTAEQMALVGERLLNS